MTLKGASSESSNLVRGGGPTIVSTKEKFPEARRIFLIIHSVWHTHMNHITQLDFKFDPF